jgi:hypothetical protein
MINRQFLKIAGRFSRIVWQARWRTFPFACSLTIYTTTWAAGPSDTTRSGADASAAISSVVATLTAATTVAKIQEALDALPASGGEVVLPAGKIIVTRPIMLNRNGLSLRGAGNATVLYLANDANCPIIIMGEPVNDPRHVSHLRVSDLFIDGNRAHQQRETWRVEGEGSEIRNNGITVQNVSDSVIENVTTARCRSGGLVTTLNTRRLTVRNLNSFDNEFDGLACFMTSYCTFSQLNLHDNTDGAGISLDGNFGHNVIDTAALSGNDLGIFMRWSHDNLFRNISIRDYHTYGVFMAENVGETSVGQSQTDCVDNSFVNISGNENEGLFRVNDGTCKPNMLAGAKFPGNIHAELSLALPGLLIVK